MVDGYAARPAPAIRLPGGGALVAAGGPAREVPAALVELLQLCPGFATLEEHGARIARARGGDAREIAGALATLAAEGLLLSTRELLAGAPTGEDHAPSVDAIAIPTRSRPEALRRCLDSHLANAHRYGRYPAVTVVDSGDEEPTRAVLRELAARWPAPVRHAGAGEKRRFAAALARAAGIDPAVVSFALLGAGGVGSDTGANRNALLLAHAGAAFLSADDDTLCELHAHPPRAPFALRAAGDPTEVTLFPDADTARAEVPLVDACLLALHERLLGRSVAACLEGAALEPLAPAQLASVVSGQGRIAVTQSGILGDSGARYPSFYLFDHPELTPALAGERGAALAASRQVLRAVTAPTATAGGFLMTTCLAYDHRQLLPPFFPAGRGSDLLFGRMLQLCRDDSFVGHVPVAITHLPTDGRQSSAAALWPAEQRPEMRLVLGLALNLVALAVRASCSGERRLRLLGRHLGELGRQPWAALEELLRPRHAELVAAILARGQRQLARPDAPPRWKRHLAAYLETRRRELTASLAPTNLPPDAAPQMLVRFGALCEAWPDLVAAARGLATGDGLATGL